jgi:hypothetical protein
MSTTSRNVAKLSRTAVKRGVFGFSSSGFGLGRNPRHEDVIAMSRFKEACSVLTVPIFG